MGSNINRPSLWNVYHQFFRTHSIHYPQYSKTKSAEEYTLFEGCFASAIVSILIDTFAILPVEKVTINIQYDKFLSISKTINCSMENIQKYNALEEKPLDFLHSL